MSPITTHILDTTLGRPARDVLVILERWDGDWVELGQGRTNADGRVTTLLPAGTLQAGVHRLRFQVQSYFDAAGRSSFYPEVPIVFQIEATDEHYHVPLLLNPFGYSTYRGS